MLISMKKKDIDLITCSDLSQKCFEPLIDFYKRGVSKETNFTQFKEQFYKQLSEGQRALFMFYVYYNHTSKSLIEFYWWNAYYMAQPKSWLALKASARYFKDESMLLLLEKIELVLKQHNHPNTLEAFTVTREELGKNKELQASIRPLHIIFENTSPLTIRKINDFIEKNIHEFVEIGD
ncbi:hypothetical protein JFL43_03100 [Viridibacillus sp. YIM B01967]|uniref:Uncharacterized protein n=1 Tax=Viridibacillus soli TaxID=2798301 RepID=A0ABS1H392_9BACL|nr:hypothetical protein [Viridibacillus soli]MBK3493860.1 hypothetical protein [Viridibacillus soli]